MPKVVCPSVVGWCEDEGAMDDGERYFAGTSRLHASHANPVQLKKPRENAKIVNWDAVEELWKHGYSELHLNSKEHPVMTADTPFSTAASKQKHMELLFEKFEVPCMYLAYDAVLSTFSYGRCHALVVECGAGSTRIVPVHDGQVLKQPAQESMLGGEKLTERLFNLVTESNPELEIVSHYSRVLQQREKLDANELKKRVPPETERFYVMELFEDMKKTICHTPDSSMMLTQNEALTPKSYVLPDGNELTVGADRFKVPEVLFSPMTDSKGIHRLIYDSVQACDPDLRREMLHHMLFCGGGSTFPQLGQRLHNEVSRMVPSTFKVKLVSASPLEKRFNVFTGGSILASLGSFQQLWISKKEYDEIGAEKLVEQRCL